MASPRPLLGRAFERIEKAVGTLGGPKLT